MGSTSVPGLLAKPVVDLAVRVPGGLGLRDVDARLAEAGRVEVATEVCARTRAYTAAKSSFVQEVVDRARASRGLPTVAVGDKS